MAGFERFFYVLGSKLLWGGGCGQAWGEIAWGILRGLLLGVQTQGTGADYLPTLCVGALVGVSIGARPELAR